eukprot:530714-Rhodomonas_salina.2
MSWKRWRPGCPLSCLIPPDTCACLGTALRGADCRSYGEGRAQLCARECAARDLVRVQGGGAHWGGSCCFENVLPGWHRTCVSTGPAVNVEAGEMPPARQMTSPQAARVFLSAWRGDQMTASWRLCCEEQRKH